MGKKFGKLEVIDFDHKDGYKYYWKCKCECGKETIVLKGNLLSNITKSCGCIRSYQSHRGHGDISLTYFNHIKNDAIRRNLKFAITSENIWDIFNKQNHKCVLSGKILTMGIRKNKYRNGEERTASLDRINSSEGYTIDNIQWIHKDINIMKNDYNQSYFIDICKQIASHSQ